MKRGINMKSVFWASTIFLFALNIVGIIIFRNNIRWSKFTFLNILIFIGLFLRGVDAYTKKEERYLFNPDFGFLFNRTKYNFLTRQQLNDFYTKAILYFAILPFYLPLAVFSHKYVHSLWSILLVFLSIYVVPIVNLIKKFAKIRKRKFKHALWEKEKEEQEKREELGDWK